MCGRHAMRQSRAGLQHAMLQKLDRPGAGNRERANLVIFAMHYQDRHVDHLEIVKKLGFGEDLNTVVMSLDAAHHTLPPPVLSYPLRYNGTRPGEAIEGNRDVFIELRAMLRRPFAQTVDDCLRYAIRIVSTLHKGRRNCTDEDGFGHASFAVARDITRHLTSARGVPDVDGILQIERGDEFGTVRGVRVHIVPMDHLGGAAMPTI